MPDACVLQVLSLLAQEFGRDFFRFILTLFLKLQQFCSFIAFFGLLVLYELRQEGEAHFLVKRGELLVVVDQNVILLLCPLLFLVNFLLTFPAIEQILSFPIDFLILEHDVIVVVVVNLEVLLLATVLH